MDINPASRFSQTIRSSEIDIFDLFIVFAKYRRLGIAVFVLVAGASFGVAFYPLPVYRYSVLIEIGEIPAESKATSRPIESLVTAQGKIRESYYPQASRQLMKAQGPQVRIPRIGIHQVADSTLVVLDAEAGLGQEANYLSVLDAISSALVKDHMHVTRAIEMRYQSQLERQKIKLAEMSDPFIYSVKENTLRQGIDSEKAALSKLVDTHKLLQVALQTTRKKKQLLDRQIADVRAALALTTKNRLVAADSTGSSSEAMTLLMLDSGIQNDRNRLAALEDQRYVEYPVLLEEARKKIGSEYT